MTQQQLRGKCGAALNPEPYPYIEKKILSLCPYCTSPWTEYIDREKYEYPLTPERTLSTKCPTCPISDIKLTTNQRYNETLAYVKVIFPEETETSQDVMVKEVYERIPKRIPAGCSWKNIILGSIHLTAKCPANADNPLKITEIADKVKPFTWNTPNLDRYIRKGAAALRREGAYAEVCRVSALQYIVSRKEDLRKLLTEEQYQKCVEVTKWLGQNEEHYRWRQGKAPTVIAAATTYAINAHLGYGINQTKIAEIFSVTQVAIGRQYPTILSVIENNAREIPL